MIDLIITAVEFAAFRNISKKLDEDKVNEAIMLAQESDLQDSLGEFYFELVENLENPDFADLLVGVSFTYNGRDYVHHGIKKYLADLVYARYIMNLNINLTPFGVQTKFTDDSSAVDRMTIRDISKQAQMDAGIKFRAIEKYILSKPDVFKRFRDYASDSQYQGIRISRIDRAGGDCSNDVLYRRFNEN